MRKDKWRDMKILKYIAVCLAAGAIVSCASLIRTQTHPWLESKAGPSDIQLTGTWNAGATMGGGWGNGIFVQEGSHFTGSFSLYSVEGVVNGNDVYMVIGSGRAVYTAHLKKASDGNFVGKTAYQAIIDQPEAVNAEHSPIFLKKPAP